MGGDIAIKIEGLGKCYNIGETIDYRRAFRNFLSRLRRSNEPPETPAGPEGETLDPRLEDNRFWALRDVNLDVDPGEVLGVIGANGAGKSTLLKILTRVTEPTEGQAMIRGRVGSLLEVGTGFNPELTGRENVYLNGSILGMRRDEISRKFDEIVEFSGCAKFIDTPVKRYSSGMRVRLAFAVAANLDPEILLIDEVLAVGDLDFQEKCLGKMGDVVKAGRTILFVSHNMTTIQSLCSRCAFIRGGKLEFVGPVQEAINRYTMSKAGLSATPLRERKDRQGTGEIRLTSVEISPLDEPERDFITCGDRLRVRVGYEAWATPRKPRFLIGIYNAMSQGLFRLDTHIAGRLPPSLPQNGVLTCETGPVNASPGPIFINIAVKNEGGALADYVQHALDFKIRPSDFYSTGKLFDSNETLYLLEQKWSAHETEN